MHIPICHFFLKVFFVFFGDWHDVIFFFVVIIFKEHWEHILHCLSLSVTHDVDAGIYYLCQELMLQRVTAAIASNDATHLPELNVVEEVMAWDAYLANEQFIYIVGVYEFFPFFLPGFGSLSLGSPTGIL